MIKYHFNNLSVFEKKAYKIIHSAIEKHSSFVTLLGMFSVDCILNLMKSISYDFPELFYVDFSHASIIQNDFQTIVNISYLYNMFNISTISLKMKNNIDNVLKKISIEPEDSALAKCRKIHNYMVRNIKYSYETLKDSSNHPFAYTIYGVFNDKSAVCEGIAKAFKLICDRVGVESFVITGSSSLEGTANNANHAWNIVKIGNTYNHIDVTWDMCISEQCNHNRYDYFLISDQYIRADHNYDFAYKCDSMDNSFFKNNKSLIKGKHEVKNIVELAVHNKKRVIYFKYMETVDENMETKINRFIVEQISITGYSYTYTFINNIKQGIFFIKLNI